jgi:hypothetical protein
VEGRLPEEEEEEYDERAGVQASCLEPTSVAEEPAGGHEHGLRDSEQEQRANLICHGDVGVTAAVRVLLF